MRDPSRHEHCLPEVLQEFAAVALVRGRLEPGAALIGRSERLRREMNLTLWDAGDYERTIGALRDRLGESRFEEERQRGAALTDEEAIALARSID